MSLFPKHEITFDYGIVPHGWKPVAFRKAKREFFVNSIGEVCGAGEQGTEFPVLIVVEDKNANTVKVEEIPKPAFVWRMGPNEDKQLWFLEKNGDMMQVVYGAWTREYGGWCSGELDYGMLVRPFDPEEHEIPKGVPILQRHKHLVEKRTKVEPVENYRPFKSTEDVRPRIGELLRFKDNHEKIWLVTGTNGAALFYGGMGYGIAYHLAFERCELSMSGQTWRPCGVRE